jgi:hypothetical protein
MERPIYVLAAAPSTQSELRDFFESGDKSILALLERPPAFRRGGWDLGTASPPRIVGGEYLESGNQDDKIIRLYEDGTLLARVAADSFLAWPIHPPEFSQNPKLNTLALVEFTTAFVYFYRQLLGRFMTPLQNIKFQVKFQNAEVAGKRIYVIPFPVKSIAWQFEDLPGAKHPISHSNPQRDITISANQVQDEPDVTACLLVEKVFLFFDVPSNELPYVKQEKPRRVDVHSFSKS